MTLGGYFILCLIITGVAIAAYGYGRQQERRSK